MESIEEVFEENVITLDSGELLVPLESLNEKMEEILLKEEENKILEEKKKQEELKKNEEFQQKELNSLEEYKEKNSIPSEIESWEELDMYYKHSSYENLNAMLSQQVEIREQLDQLELINENQKQINEDLVYSLWIVVIVVITLKLSDAFFKQISRW